MTEASQIPFCSNQNELKKFQVETVDHLYRRLFTDSDATNKFLVADDVGLGKTMVARGLIKRIIKKFYYEVDRIDIVYICSSGAIAAQNLRRLNVMKNNTHISASRATLFALELLENGSSSSGKVNFISLTPKTTFKLRNSRGTAKERALIHRLLTENSPFTFPKELKKILRGRCNECSWDRHIDHLKGKTVNQSILRKFQDEVPDDVQDQIQTLCCTVKLNNGSTDDVAPACAKLTGNLRKLLANVSIEYISPRLIILDEFQRFHDLLTESERGNGLAQKLFDYTDRCGTRAKTLLLSATPYRMQTLSEEPAIEGDHYQRFKEVLEFLFENGKRSPEYQEIISNLPVLRREMENFARNPDAYNFEYAVSIKDSIQANLLKVMCRTERGTTTSTHEPQKPLPLSIDSKDLSEACATGGVEGAIFEIRSARGSAERGRRLSTVEYWKSCPWALNFMQDYMLFKLLSAELKSPSKNLIAAINEVKNHQICFSTFSDYNKLFFPNARMRKLTDLAMQNDMAKRLWIPPSLPYFGDAVSVGKTLVFSDWSMVPNAISGLLSYEFERRIGMKISRKKYFGSYRPRPLRIGFASGKDRNREDVNDTQCQDSKCKSEKLAIGLRVLQLVIPSPVLAQAVDPLKLVSPERPFTQFSHLRNAVKLELRDRSRKLKAMSKGHSNTVTWNWVGATALDILDSEFEAWIKNCNPNELVREGVSVSRRKSAMAGNSEPWQELIGQLVCHAENPKFDVKSDTLLSHLVDVALGSPATCAFRSLSRIAPLLPPTNEALLASATKIGMAFRTLFNRPETRTLLIEFQHRGPSKHRGDPYWRVVLRYAAEHDLQSVLDEYVHILSDGEGLMRNSGKSAQENSVREISKKIVDALSINVSKVKFCYYSLNKQKKEEIVLHSKALRTRFAMRFSHKSEDEKGIKRAGLVRTAFNSPFHPFVLATTSIGQEGLDFHHYCYRIVHWNMPRNPVDMEQREGRVNRYKNHAIRLNISRCHSNAAFKSSIDDPWFSMFSAADNASISNDKLAPFWIFDGRTRIEQHILLLPFSRESIMFPWLKRSLAIYKLAFGQPRPDDLLTLLNLALDRSSNDDNSSIDEKLALLSKLQICLQPSQRGSPATKNE